MSPEDWEQERAEAVRFMDSPKPPLLDWHCICGSGDDGEWHSLMCVASNTPDDVWYGDYPPRECDHENGECHDIEHQRR